MKSKYSLVILIIFMAASLTFSQREKCQSIISVNFITCQIEFADTIVTGYRQSMTRIYPDRLDPVTKLLYSCKFTIKWNGEDGAYTEEPFVVICYLPDNSFRKVTLNDERFLMTTDKFYDFSFDIYSDKKLSGWATLELGKYKYSDDDNYTDDNNIRYDRTTLYIK
jgi:hypothetical protein